MHRFLVSQAYGTLFAATAVTLTIIHPAIHHIDNGTVDSILDYLYATALNGMNHSNTTNAKGTN